MWLDREPRLLTIIGPGGTGKTRFAIELVRFLAEEADGGTVFVPLAPVRDAALVVPQIAARWAPPMAVPPRSRRASVRSEPTSSSTTWNSSCRTQPDRSPSCSMPPRLSGSWQRAASRCG